MIIDFIPVEVINTNFRYRSYDQTKLPFLSHTSKHKKEFQGEKGYISEYSNINTSLYFALNIKNIHGTNFYIIYTTDA